MIEAKNLSKYYGRHCAVRQIDFTINKGEIIGFLGPNGAGKSTVMNMMTGYLPASSGEIKIDGLDISGHPRETKKKIGYLPEIPPLYPEMTVREHLKFSAELKGVSSNKRKDESRRVMELAGIAHVETRLIGNLSKGYRQRTGLAQALLGDPPILILDEPTVGLDPKQIIEMRNLIKNLGENHTIILSSHILPEVSAVCRRLLVLNKGKLAASETPEDLSRRLSGHNGIQMKVKGDPQEIRKAIESLTILTDIDCRESDEEGICNLNLKTADNTDIRESVSRRLCENKLLILQMRPLDISLEEIFLNLTTDEGDQ